MEFSFSLNPESVYPEISKFSLFSELPIFTSIQLKRAAIFYLNSAEVISLNRLKCHRSRTSYFAIRGKHGNSCLNAYDNLPGIKENTSLKFDQIERLVFDSVDFAKLFSDKSQTKLKTEWIRKSNYVLTEIFSLQQQYRSTLSPVNGELEVSMLQYEQEQTQFVIRIERGRNLPPKDLSSQTSDPYVLVSTIPDWSNEGIQKSSTVKGNAYVQ